MIYKLCFHLHKIYPAVILSGLFLCSFYAGGQTNYYVSPSGNNSNPGNKETPWLTIQSGLNKLKTGDTLNLMNGTFNEKIKFSVSGITLRNYSGCNPVIDASGITSQVPVINVTDVSAINIQGIELRNNIMTDAQGILISGSCRDITISECKIHDIHFSSNPNAAVKESTNAQGIIVYGTNAGSPVTNLKIINNQLYNCRLGYSEGIAVNGNVSGFEISGNTVYNLTNIGIDMIGFEGTCSNTSVDQARNGIVRNNLVHHCISAYATSGGLYVDGGRNIIIENNTSYHNGYGIEIGCENTGKVTDLITVRNNIFYDNEVCALALGGWNYPKSGKVTNSTFRNNTCFSNDYQKTGNGEIYLSYSENCIIENNIFFTTSENNLVYAELSQPSLSFNYNLIYCSSGTENLSADWNNKSYNSYTAFVSGSGMNKNSLFANPAFLNADIGSPDFHTQNNSPAINAGNPGFTPAPDEVDMDGKNRKTGIIDCGAYELNNISNFMAGNKTTPLLKIFPNPSNGKFSVVCTNSEIHNLVIYDGTGKQMNFHQIANTLLNQINISDYQNGIYYLVAINKDFNPFAVEKIIINKSLSN